MATFAEEAGRQLRDSCFDLSTFETPYSNDDRGVSYSGIMFDLFTKSELEILTLEIDVRLAEVTDFHVEVYTTAGGFLAKINNPSEWTLVAKTEAIISSGGGIIIPQRAFENIQVGARERISFYVQMRGPWIENQAQALIKTGEMSVGSLFWKGVCFHTRGCYSSLQLFFPSCCWARWQRKRCHPPSLLEVSRPKWRAAGWR